MNTIGNSIIVIQLAYGYSLLTMVVVTSNCLNLASLNIL